MRALVLPVIVLGLAACGEREGEAAPAPESMTPAVAPSREPAAAAPTLDEAGLRRVCRAVLSRVHEQAVGAVSADAVSNGVVSLSWPAPVDGGRRTAECRVSGDVVSWRGTNLPTPEAERWMDGPTDPILRFALTDDAVTVIQTRPDGSTSRTDVAVGEGA